MAVIYHPNDLTHHNSITDISFAAALARISELPDFIKQCKYFIHGTEICPTTGTEHLQAFFVFKNDQSLANLRNKFSIWLGFNSTIAWKKADSNTEECIDYCSKDGKDIFEYGSRPKGKGARSDLLAVGESIKAGYNMIELFDAHPASFLKFAPGMQKAVALVSRQRDWKTEVFWVHGPTGTGKSRWVMQNVDRSDLFVKDGNSKWFDGYASQRNVLFDDFRPSKELPFSLLLRLLDRFPVTVEGKGCSMNFSPERIFITTPLPPLETFQHLDWMKAEELAQLTRRITQVIHFPNLDSITQYALLSPFVLVLNDWGISVGQQTRVRPAVAKTPTKASLTKRNGPPAPIQPPTLLPVTAVLPVEDLTQADYSSDSSDMKSIQEQSGDSEPEFGDSLNSQSQRSQDSTETDDSFFVQESADELAMNLATARAKASKRSVITVQKPSKQPTTKKTKTPGPGKTSTNGLPSAAAKPRHSETMKQVAARHKTIRAKAAACVWDSSSSDSSSDEESPDLR